MNDLKITGKKIKDLRQKNGFSQQSIAYFLGVDQSLISKVENGKRALSVDMIEKICNLFGIEHSDFEHETEVVPPVSRAFTVNELSVNDMETISVINRIALNSVFMANLLAEAENK